MQQKVFILSNYYFAVCTSRKHGSFSMTAAVTKNNTIFINWSYEVEHCDESFLVYWSNEGPLSPVAKPKRTIVDINTTSFEVTGLGKAEILVSVYAHCNPPYTFEHVFFGKDSSILEILKFFPFEPGVLEIMSLLISVQVLS